MGGWQAKHDEAFETNNWYDDIFTRDRSPEGAEEAIDLSRGFKNPNFKGAAAGPRPQQAHAGTEAVSVRLPER